MYCRSCGAQLQEGAVVCIKCGLRPLEGAKFCNFCGAETQPQAVICTSCGGRLGPTRIGSAPVSAALAGLLNWLWPGVAYFLLGQKSKGILFCVLTFFGAILAVMTCGVGLLIYVPYAVLLIVDAVVLANKANRGERIGEWQFF